MITWGRQAAVWKLVQWPGFMVAGSAYFNVCIYKGWAIKLALAPRPLMIYCVSPLAAAMILTVAALRIVLAHGSKPT
jgi:hypothetical protein